MSNHIHRTTLYPVLFALYALFSFKVLVPMNFVRIAGPEPIPQLAGSVVSRANFFKDLMASTICPTEPDLKHYLARNDDNSSLLYGFDEFEKSCLLDVQDGIMKLQAQPNLLSLFSSPKKYQCGHFEQNTISELQDRCNGMDLPGGGTFNVIEGIDTGWNSWFRHHVDIGALQADPANRDAVFQVASNFNALETVNAHQNIDIQFLEQYINDLTQGPAASISAAPGLIQRHYFMYYDSNQPKNTWPQTQAHHVNFLDLIPDGLPVSVAGYVVLPHNPGVLTPENYGSIKIGYQGDVQVTHGFMVDRNRHYFIADHNPNQMINQVFTAAIDLGVTNRQHLLLNDARAFALAQQVLNAAYEGTLRKAFVEGKRRVFLTLVGCGVFANNVIWAFNAIQRMSHFIRTSGMEVTLIRYSSVLNDPVRGHFGALAQLTGGVYRQYRNDGIYQPNV